MKIYLFGAVCAVVFWGLLTSNVQAQSLSINEIACNKGGAEACFYAGADYANGKGVVANKPKAAELFVKACNLGIPDGCFYTGGMYRKGTEGIAANPSRGVELYEKACTMGHEDSCKQIAWILGSTKSTEQDMPRMLSAFEVGCVNESVTACGWASALRHSGNNGKYPQFIDVARAAPMAEKACDLGDKAACITAEIIFANPDSQTFDATNALKYINVNCANNVKESCANLGRIYAEIEDFEFAVGPYEKSCQLGNIKICDYAKDLRRYVNELAAWNAKQEARRAEMAAMLKAGDYNSAVATAVSVYSSTVYAHQAVMATSAAGRMANIDDYDLKVLEHWFQSGQVGALVRAEMRQRGMAISGEDNSWANDMKMIKSANDRFNASRSTSTYRPVEQGPSPAGASSATNATAKTREKYRYAHCTMNNNANRYLCQ
jgi:TPR repeat protein